jgi:hypothetical protein
MMIKRDTVSEDGRLHLRAAALAASFACSIACGAFSSARAKEAAFAPPSPQIWTCSYIAATPKGPLQITARFQVMGEELAEIETIPEGLNFSEKYKILENTDTYIVAAISIAKLGDHPPPGIGALVIIIAKQNGLFQQSGSILGLRAGAPTLGHCESR